MNVKHMLILSLLAVALAACSSDPVTSSSSSGGSSGGVQTDGGADARTDGGVSSPCLRENGCIVYVCTCGDGSKVDAPTRSGSQCDDQDRDLSCIRACQNKARLQGALCKMPPGGGDPPGKPGGYCTPLDACSYTQQFGCADLNGMPFTGPIPKLVIPCPASGVCLSEAEYQKQHCGEHSVNVAPG